MESKRAKMENEKEDRISDLPDHMIQHILSHLPSTKDAVRTGILSKRWRNQWTRVPVLNFHSTTCGMSSENFFKFIDDTLNLHDCSKIKKFHLQYLPGDHRKDPKLGSKIRFATTKAVEELHLMLNYDYMLPEFLFNNASLVSLTTINCTFIPYGKVNWECLAILCMSCCRLTDQVMDLILSGSPLLKMLVFVCCFRFKKLVIASKSLKILCLARCRRSIFDLEISCPKLESMVLQGPLNVRTAKLSNLPSSLSAYIDFHHNEDECNGSRMSLIKDILNQLRHVKKLTFGGWFMEYVSAIPMGGQFSPLLNIKRLTLESHNVCGITYLLRNSPVLEMLVINATLYDKDYQNFGENYWSDGTVFNCLASHLKTIKINIGFLETDGKREFMLNFVQFFLKNARMLEKIVVELKDDGTFSQELLSLPRCSQSAIIELVHSK